MDLRLAKFCDKTGRGHGSDLLDVIVELPGRAAASVVFDPVLLRPIDLDLFRSLGNDVDAFLPRQTFGKLVSDIFFQNEASANLCLPAGTWSCSPPPRPAASLGCNASFAIASGAE